MAVTQHDPLDAIYQKACDAASVVLQGMLQPFQPQIVQHKSRSLGGLIKEVLGKKDAPLNIQGKTDTLAARIERLEEAEILPDNVWIAFQKAAENEARRYSRTSELLRDLYESFSPDTPVALNIQNADGKPVDVRLFPYEQCQIVLPHLRNCVELAGKGTKDKTAATSAPAITAI